MYNSTININVTSQSIHYRCEFASITPEEILRDRLVFGIRDDKVRERLLREPSLTLTKADEICRAAESLNIQMKTITDESSTLIHAVKFQGYQTEKSFHKEIRLDRISNQ